MYIRRGKEAQLINKFNSYYYIRKEVLRLQCIEGSSGGRAACIRVVAHDRVVAYDGVRGKQQGRVAQCGGVAVGQGRKRGCSMRTYTGTSLPPCPLSQPWPTVKKGQGVAVGLKEGWWRLAVSHIILVSIIHL